MDGCLVYCVVTIRQPVVELLAQGLYLFWGQGSGALTNWGGVGLQFNVKWVDPGCFTYLDVVVGEHVLPALDEGLNPGQPLFITFQVEPLF